ncbi:MAG: class I SAM-dependent methyltransferase [Mycobacterium sp.]|nr:class I SAM-dependent methyltransferase [Mycobacterium sp.]
MNPRVLRVLYGVLAAAGLNPALRAADVPDSRLVELVEGAKPLQPGRALDLGCGTGRNTLYLTRHNWNAVGIDMLGRAIDEARSRAVGAAASARFIQGDVTELSDLGIGDGYNLIVDSGCYYGSPRDQRDAYAAGVTEVAAAGALLLMAGFTKIPGVGAGIGEDDLRRRFDGWHVQANVPVSVGEIIRHTRIPFPLKAGLRSGRLEIRRFELTRIAD